MSNMDKDYLGDSVYAQPTTPETDTPSGDCWERMARHQLTDFVPKSERWSIGHYYDDSSICVNLEFDGRRYHRHDCGVSLIPRFIRLGWAIASIERESGLLTYRDELKARRHLPPLPDQATCKHKFIDSQHCLRCGWVPPNDEGQRRVNQ